MIGNSMISDKLLNTDYPLNNKININELLFNKIEYTKKTEEFNNVFNDKKSDTLILRNINTNKKKENKSVNYNYILNNCKTETPIIKKTMEEDYHNTVIDVPNSGDDDNDNIDKLIQVIMGEISYINNQINNMSLSNFIMKPDDFVLDNEDDKVIFTNLSKIIIKFNDLNEQPPLLINGKKIKSSYLMFDGKQI